eukprot:TRINITY_DN1444_c0_g1_i1.p1 TRINITY_DN1444_c0_g1~~TRINITY_DN1444_c0_g1_i1.p1  ORF type:complete len:835 (+),score=231.53 TRINITY_DN1444_c0_g1_i1:155-2659(+)
MDPWDDFGDMNYSDNSNDSGEEYIDFDIEDFDSGDYEYDSNEDYEMDETGFEEERDNEDDVNTHSRLGMTNFDSDDDERRRMPRSKTQKMFDGLNRCVRRVDRCLVANDWVAARVEFDNFEKEKDKAQWYIKKEGYPGIYIGGLSMVHDAINSIEDKENMRADNAKALTAVSTKLKKIFNKEQLLEQLVEDYKENPDSFIDLDDHANEFDLDDERREEESDEDYLNKTLNYWYEFSEDEDKTAKKVKEKRERKETDETEEKVEEKRKPWTPKRVNKKIKQLISQRGYKQFQKNKTLLLFEFLFRQCAGLRRRIQVAFHFINAIFDASSGSIHIPFRHWIYVYRLLTLIVNTLFAHPEIRLATTEEEIAQATEGVEEGQEPENVVIGSLTSIIQRLNEELWRALQNTDTNTQKYEDRAGYSVNVLSLARYIEKYLTEKKKDTSRCCFIQLTHLYYIKSAPAPKGTVLDQALAAKDPKHNPEADAPESEIVSREFPVFEINMPPVQLWENIEDAVQHLTSQIYKNGEVQLRTLTVLYHVYHLAVFGKYFQGRDLLMMTHIPDKIHTVDISVQVLYNRCMAQLGIAAFRLLRMSDVHACVSDLLMGGKSKELLAQGISYRQQEKSAEEESRERSRQYPYHMHINIDILEAVILIASMILNIPNLSENGTKKSFKYFKKAVDGYKKNVFIGPPENTREKIIVASEKLFNGDWKACQNMLDQLDIWSLIDDSDTLKKSLYDQIRKESLRSFLLTNGKFYDSLSIDLLSSRFELDPETIHSVISKLIFTKKIFASLDQVNGCVKIQSEVKSETEKLAQRYAEKITSLLEATKKMEEKSAV